MLARELQDSPTEATIREWASDTIDTSDAILGVIWRINAMTNMAGQLFVRDIELDGKIRQLEATGDTAGTFLNLPFAEAIRAFESRRLMSPDEFDALIDQERSRAFTLRRAIADGVAERALVRLNAAMRPGGQGLGEFITDFSSGVTGEGFPGGTRNYLETVYRTTTATSYGAGRYRQQTDPAVLAGGGLVLEYRTAQDSRVRSDHAALDGEQWAPDDPQVALIYPPNGFNCRCVCALVEAESATRSVDAEQVNAAIQDGFRGAPGEVIEREAN